MINKPYDLNIDHDLLVLQIRRLEEIANGLPVGASDADTMDGLVDLLGEIAVQAAPSPASDAAPGWLPKGKLKEYLGSLGSVCPFCQSEELSHDNVEAIDGTWQQEIECLNCGAEWVDVYSLDRVFVSTQPFHARHPGESS